jgi:predicted nucleic acid-binding protein
LTLVDTNILLDVVNETPHWVDWAESKLVAAARAGDVSICDVVYAEFSVRYPAPSDVDRALALVGIGISPTPREALFLAGKAFARYKASGGTRTGVLPDFFIGAHAATMGMPLLTRDPRRYRTYFPSIQLIVPEGH